MQRSNQLLVQKNGRHLPVLGGIAITVVSGIILALFLYSAAVIAAAVSQYVSSGAYTAFVIIQHTQFLVLRTPVTSTLIYVLASLIIGTGTGFFHRYIPLNNLYSALSISFIASALYLFVTIRLILPSLYALLPVTGQAAVAVTLLWAAFFILVHATLEQTRTWYRDRSTRVRAWQPV